MLLRSLPVALVLCAVSAACSSTAPPAAVGGTSAAASTVTALTVTTTRAPVATAPVVRRPTGTVIPYETGIFIRTPSEFSAYAFGSEAEVVMAAVSKAIGSSVRDTGWHRDELCDGTSTRRVVWGDLELVFTKGANGQLPMSLTFQQWYVAGTGSRPTPLTTPEGLGIGSTVGDLKRLYTEAKISKPRPNEDMGLYITLPEGGPFIQGFTRDTSDSALVQSMWAGLACQRIE